METIDQWLQTLNLGKYAPVFAEAEIDLLALPLLSDHDLVELGLPLGPRRKILNAARKLDNSVFAADAASPAAPDTPPSQYAPITASTSQPTAERRHLTVLFVDLVNSTGLSTTLDAEDMRELIRRYQSIVTDIIVQYHGFVARYIGDGILCYFGWPQANEDDAERCIRAGLAVTAAVRHITTPAGQPMATRLGVASGVVVIGDLIGSGASEQAAAVGETPNLAARLQQLAAHNQLVASESTRNLLGNLFELEYLGKQTLKGIPDATGAYVVIGDAAPISRFEARQSGTLPPIIGRRTELRSIDAIWQKAIHSAGQLVFITGEAGIGKSRTLRAIIDQIDDPECTRIILQCSPYYTGTALHPVLSQLGKSAGFSKTDNDATKFKKLAAISRASAADLEMIAALLDINTPSNEHTGEHSPTTQRQRTLEAFCQHFTRQSDNGPLLLVVEDMHWIDPTTLELFSMLSERLSKAKVLLLATSREQPAQTLSAQPNARIIRLERLDRNAIQSIVEGLTHGKPVADSVLKVIESKTDGIPLYVEEITKTLLESGQLIDTGECYRFDDINPDYLAIPDSLHDSLMARLDRMQPIKLVAQMAACIGRSFHYQLLFTVAKLSEEALVTALNSLVAAELIVAAEAIPDTVYNFKHALLRDAAYNSLLKEKRRVIHGRILQQLRRDSDTEPELLAHHATNAAEHRAAAEYWELAAEQALARPAYREAISHFERAIELTDTLSDSDERRACALRIRAKISYASTAFYGFGHALAAKANSAARELIDRVENSEHRMPLLYGGWTIHNARAEYIDSLHIADLLVRDAVRSEDRIQRLNAHRMRAVSLTMKGDFSLSDGDFEIAHSLYDPEIDRTLGARYGLDPGVSIRVYWATSLLARGEAAQASSLMHNIAEDAERSNHPPTYSAALFQLGLQSCIRRDPDCAEWTEQSMHFAIKHDLAFWRALAHAVAGAHYHSVEDYDTALSETGTALAMLQDMGVVSNTGLFSAIHAASLAALGRHDEASVAGQQTLGVLDLRTGDWAAAEIYRILGESCLRHSNHTKAVEALEKSVAIAERQSAALWRLRATAALAQVHQHLGDRTLAHSSLQTALSAMPDGSTTLEDVSNARAMLQSF